MTADIVGSLVIGAVVLRLIHLAYQEIAWQD